MRLWLAGEPTLDELLCDEIMGPIVASAGMSREQFRSILAEIAGRLSCRARQDRSDESGFGARRVAVGR